MTVELKDIVFLGLGTAVGLLTGVAIYWLPLGQFANEWRSIWHLTRRRYNCGDELIVKAGTDFRALDSVQVTSTVTQDTRMKVWHDEGIGWHHTHSGWKRARILHVYPAEGAGIEKVYRICHWDLKED